MKHLPLFWLAISFSGGILLASCLDLDSRPWMLLALACGGAAAALLWLDKRDHLQVALIHLLVLSIGAAVWSGHDFISTDSIGHWVPPKRTLCRIRGVIVNRPRVQLRQAEGLLPSSKPLPESRTRFQLSGLAIETSRPPALVKFRGRIQVSVKGELAYLKYGEEIRCLGWLSRPGGPSNPGEFDYGKYLSHYGIHALLWVGEPGNVQVLARNQRPGLRTFLFGLNDWARDKLYETLEPREAALLDGLMLGNRENIPESDEEAFIVTGTRHILAISGLHVGLVAAAILFVFRLLRVPGRPAYLMAIPVTIFYALFSGAKTPSIRAAVMVCVFLAGLLLRRRSSPLNLLGLSALIILGAAPNQLFTVGFQLSFLAVLGILLLVDTFHLLFFQKSLSEQLMKRGTRFRPIQEAAHYLVIASFAPLAAWIFTMPLTACYFNMVSPAAVPANILICPLVFLILLSGMFSLPALFLVPALGSLLLHLTGAMTWLLLEVIHLVALVPFAGAYGPAPSAWLIAGYYVFLLLWIFWPDSGLPEWALRCAATLLVALPLIVQIAGAVRPTGDLRVSILDVGHGCATFIELPDGSNLLYDVGAYHRNNITSWSVAPFLWTRRRRQIDRVVLTHLDFDHYSGFPELLERFRVRELLVPPRFGGRPAGKDILELAHRHGVKITTVVDGDLLVNSGPLRVQALNPPQTAKSLSDNNQSIVLRITFIEQSLLLTGDIESRAIRYLLENHKTELRSHVLLVPHHGSLTSMTEKFISAVGPRAAIISGRSYRIKKEARQTVETTGAKLLITDETGTVTVKTDGHHLEVSTFKAR